MKITVVAVESFSFSAPVCLVCKAVSSVYAQKKHAYCITVCDKQPFRYVRFVGVCN
jgi:hypothetical protein